ncbi:hypothetical protein QBC45DRAFT_114404 [Copromyces sp. CBS 386.78]|nr:hypothetical protein QBC45DRAFT_114404 [Copromyces sp. CBS 386.78]
MSDDKGDSPLSTLSNVVGLFTFTLGLLTLVVTFLSITHSADREIKDIEDKLEARESHIRQIEDHFKKLNKEAHPDLEGSLIQINLQTTLDKIKNHRQQAADALETNRKKHHWWWYNRPDVMSDVEAMETQFQHLNTIQLTFLLIITRSQQDNIDAVEVSINDLKRELRKRSDS